MQCEKTVQIVQPPFLHEENAGCWVHQQLQHLNFFNVNLFQVSQHHLPNPYALFQFPSEENRPTELQGTGRDNIRFRLTISLAQQTEFTYAYLISGQNVNAYSTCQNGSILLLLLLISYMHPMDLEPTTSSISHDYMRRKCPVKLLIAIKMAI